MKKVLVACECSQVVTNAFRTAGAEAYSCDLETCYGGHPEWHFQGDVSLILYENWDLVIAHPPCTMLAKSGVIWYRNGRHTKEDVAKAREFFMKFTCLGVPTCIENPVPFREAGLPKCTQLVCPSKFGHEFTKKTCLWLYDLPPLLPMRAECLNAESWVMHCSNRAKRRSRFWEGIAEAMAAQWLPII